MILAVYRIIMLFGACTYSRKTGFWELIENAGAPVFYILRLTSVCLYSSKGACSLRGACAKKRDNTVCYCVISIVIYILLRHLQTWHNCTWLSANKVSMNIHLSLTPFFGWLGHRRNSHITPETVFLLYANRTSANSVIVSWLLQSCLNRSGNLKQNMITSLP